MPNPVTQEEEVVDGQNGADDGSNGDGSDDQPFLKINDRVVYKTSDDAIKGFNEAGKAAISLSELKKTAKEFGLTDLDAKTVKTLFTELVGFRKEKATKAGSVKVTDKSKGGNSSSDDDEEIDPETKAALKWLEKNAGKAGYVSKKELEEIQQKLANFENSGKKLQESEFESRVEEGREELGRLLKDAGIEDLTEEETEELEETLTAWINAREERVAKFNRGGSALLALIKDGASRALPLVRPGSALTSKTSNTVRQGQKKNALVKGAPKKLPPSGGDGGGDGKNKEKENAKAFRQRIVEKLQRLQTQNED